MNRYVLLSCVGCLFLTACASNKLLDFTLLSNRSIGLECSGDLEVGAERVRGEDRQSIYLILPPRQLDADLALSRAMNSAPGSIALQDGSIVFEQWTLFPFIYSETAVIVEGFPVHSREQEASE